MITFRSEPIAVTEKTPRWAVLNSAGVKFAEIVYSAASGQFVFETEEAVKELTQDNLQSILAKMQRLKSFYTVRL